jgi:hypothetical protein
MNAYASLLARAASEVRQFSASAPEAKSFGVTWLEGIAKRLEAASSLQDAPSIEREISTIARLLTDSGPTALSPAFLQALDAIQRSKKKKSA